MNAPNLTEMSVEDLIRSGAALKNQIDFLSAQLKFTNLELTARAEFNGKKTANLVGAGFKVKVQLRENVKWVQDRILKFREFVSEERFGKLFKTTYEPTSKKAIDGFIENADPELAHGLKWCMEVNPGTPQISYEPLEEASDAQAD